MCVPHLGLAASDGSGPDGSGLLVPAQNFGHAAVGDPQLAGDDARTDTVMGHFHDFVADVVGERSPVYEDPTKLVHPTLSQRSGDCRAREGEESSRPTAVLLVCIFRYFYLKEYTLRMKEKLFFFFLGPEITHGST